MTSPHFHTYTDRKDAELLMQIHSTQAPCPTVCPSVGRGHGVEGFESESILAFLMRLYAYIASHYGDTSHDVIPDKDRPAIGTYLLKERLLTTGPDWVRVFIIDRQERPNALLLRERPQAYRGSSLGPWVILWPGAMLDRYFIAEVPTNVLYYVRQDSYTVNRAVKTAQCHEHNLRKCGEDAHVSASNVEAYVTRVLQDECLMHISALRCLIPP